MRQTRTSDVRKPSRARTRALRLAVVALGVGLVMSAGAARAGDDDDADDQTIEESIIGGIMAGIGGTNMENRGIEYRERSPLVVPPKLDLPPPASASAGVKAANWPKDPDEVRRKAAIEARKKNKGAPGDAFAPPKPISQAELNQGRTAAPTTTRPSNDPIEPGFGAAQKTLSPEQLGYTGGLWSTMFGGNKSETAPFAGEPSRESLTQPPTGYQTPSPNYAYGTGPRESLNKEYNPAKGKYGE
jgi:hypothetical protein